jgi:hypothetical protein
MGGPRLFISLPEKNKKGDFLAVVNVVVNIRFHKIQSISYISKIH